MSATLQAIADALKTAIAQSQATIVTHQAVLADVEAAIAKPPTLADVKALVDRVAAA